MMRGPTAIEGNELDAIINGHMALTNNNSSTDRVNYIGSYEDAMNNNEMLMDSHMMQQMRTVDPSQFS